MPVPREKLSNIRCEEPVRRAGPQADGALGQGELGIAEQSRGVRARLHAQTFAGRTPAQRTVEREIVRRQRLEAPPALLAGEVLTVNFDGPVGFRHVVAGLGHVEHAAPLGQGDSPRCRRDTGCGRRAGW